jgi:hypothetical protein
LRETNHPLPSQLHFWILGSVVGVPPTVRSVFTQHLPGVVFLPRSSSAAFSILLMLSVEASAL